MRSKLALLGLFIIFVTMGQAVAESAGEYLKILSGCWEGSLNGATIEERWDNPTGGMMLGTAKTVTSGIVTEFEFLKITISSKKVAYTPYINGIEAPTFQLNEAASNTTKLVFENQKHDFPKKIIYVRRASALDIELADDSEPKSIMYTLRASTCIR